MLSVGGQIRLAAPEVRQALEGRMARVVRHSQILEAQVLFVALPLIRNGRIAGVIRSSVSTSVMEERISTLRGLLILGFGVCAVLIFALAEGLTRSLSRPLESLSRAVRLPDADLPRFESGPREVVELSAALVAMRTQIRSQLESLTLQQKRQDDILKRLDDGIVVVDAGGVSFDAEQATIRILDNGPGIAVVDVALIFERFFRANPARTESGAGLGLTIARHLVEKANGSISAANRPGGGAVLTVQVPVVAMPAGVMSGSPEGRVVPS